jgi:hypothetical protein
MGLVVDISVDAMQTQALADHRNRTQVDHQRCWNE